MYCEFVFSINFSFDFGIEIFRVFSGYASIFKVNATTFIYVFQTTWPINKFYFKKRYDTNYLKMHFNFKFIYENTQIYAINL